MMFLGMLDDTLVKELNTVTLPNVNKLSIFLGDFWESSFLSRADRPNQADSRRKNFSTLTMSGSSFPDLRTFYFNTIVDGPSKMPFSMDEGLQIAMHARPRRRRHNTESSSSSEDGAFHGLSSMKEISFCYNTFLDGNLLNSLFGSSTITKMLTQLEIVHCPLLHPLRDLEVISTLLQRSLQLLRFLKIHLTPHFDGHDGFEWAYHAKISANPEHHLCNVVRGFGQRIPGLDLAIPFACDHIFVPVPERRPESLSAHELELPDIAAAPVNTLPQRLMAAGYRYRRLIFNEFCLDDDRDDERWEEMANVAGSQGEKISWELLHDGRKPNGLWAVSGCAPVEFSVPDAMNRRFNET